MSEELYRAFQGFHDKYAREPRGNMRSAMNIHQDYMQEIESTFRRTGICHRLEYTGSSYEGVKVRKSSDNDDLEFDVMVVIDKHKSDLQVLDDDATPGYGWLKLNRDDNQPTGGLDKVLSKWNFFGYISSGDLYVDPDKTVELFFSELQKLINESAQMKGKVKLRRHGPAVQMDVHPNSGLAHPRLFSVDLVPAYQVGGALYVCKPLKGDSPNRMTWRRSFSIEEKQKLSGGSKCVLRVLKVIRNREPGLAPLTSYHLKTALFYEIDEGNDWSDRALVQRLLGVLGRLEMSLANQNLPHYFIRQINLLAPMSSPSITNMRDRIKRIRNERELMKILNS